MAEKIYLKNINLDGVEYGLGITSDDIYAELGITKERFVELLSRDFYCPTLPESPTSETLTYEDTDGSVNHFQIGQPCRWLEGESYRIALCKNRTEESSEWYILPTKLSQIENDENFVNQEYVDEKVSRISVGGANLLRNSGFTGDYRTELLETETSLGVKTEVYSRPLKYWNGTAEVIDDAEALSGRAVKLGGVSQDVSLTEGKDYVISMKAKGSTLSVSCGDYTQEVALEEGYTIREFKFVFSGNDSVSLSGDATICDVQLERGTIATDWKPSVLDNDKVLDEFQKIKYLTDGIKEISSEELKGLVLTGLVKFGNYKDGSFQKENGGFSGVYNDDTDVLIWSGGTYEQAIQTMNAFREDHYLNPTTTEWETMTSFVMPHRGTGLFRGHIFATGGDISVSRVDAKSYFSNGIAGISQIVNIPGVGGVYEMTYSNGILVSSNFIPEQ